MDRDFFVFKIYILSITVNFLIVLFFDKINVIYFIFIPGLFIFVLSKLMALSSPHVADNQSLFIFDNLGRAMFVGSYTVFCIVKFVLNG